VPSCSDSAIGTDIERADAIAAMEERADGDVTLH
jgi:hypothetical protein